MVAVKEVLLQLLIACSPAFLFPLVFERRSLHPVQSSRLERTSYYNTLLVSCLISILICSLFSSDLFGIIPLNYFLPSLLVGMLYGRRRDAVILALVELVIYVIMKPSFNSSGFLLDTGLCLYPVVLMVAGRFKRSGRHAKYVTLSFFLLVGQYMSTALSFLSLPMSYRMDLTIIIFGIINIAVAVLIGGLLLFVIESTLDKEKLQMQVTLLSRRYFREAEKLQQMMDAAPLSILLLDQEGRIVSLNSTFLTYYRMEHPEAIKEDLIGSKLMEAVQDFDFEILGHRVDTTLLNRENTSELIQIKGRTFFASTSPIKRGHTEETVGAVVIIQEITELEALRTELFNADRLSLVGQMAAGITHEIRNPMAVVRGFLQLMKEKSPTSLDHYYRIVMDELDRANSIISDFLSLAQSRSVNKEECHLHDIIHELSPLLWADANLRGQSIELKLAENLPRLKLNTKEIKQVILNLSRNAMEAMEEKGQLTLETHTTPEGVELLVTDTGPGISPAKQEKMFQPFFTTKTQGTGLGLALCLSIIERHNGKISVESEEGRGTTFSVLFRRSGGYTAEVG
ncbi:PAS domain S-box protein [Paenibacillus zeisoli]|uniref:histidine kinase n=1 Tax=Paenibacillus zeisoli TaxID=2496267 RepID=A0A433XCE4_9BACL|nr:ATP-binding protein [Paenibacillus zeisoli]RUT31548.1 PAS domain S-box protein [Paenibacillus zeisoli]